MPTAAAFCSAYMMAQKLRAIRKSNRSSPRTASAPRCPATPIPPLTSYEAVQKVAQADTGTSIADLARVSHIHLFGISIIFLLTGAIFALSETPTWLRVSLVVVPYLTILMDIGSWWLTKYLDPSFFSYVVIAGGACMGLALAAQILIALWEMSIEPFKKAA